MNKKDIIEFFDSCAADWDAEMIIDTDTVNFILDKADITQNSKVLDVACGTGVLFPFYFQRKVSEVTGVDISSEMVKITKEKFPGIKVICADAHSYDFGENFSNVMIYNAFPHFTSPDTLIKNLTSFLIKGGRLTVAHGMSKEQIDNCHSGRAKNVSLALPEAETLKEMMQNYLDVDIVISDDKMYMVSGKKQ